MKKLKTVMILAAFLLLGKVGTAQLYSLEDCIKEALENNPQLKNSRLDIESASARIKEVKGALLPTIDISGQFRYYQDLPEQYAPATAFGGPEGEYTKLGLNMRQTTSGNLQMTQNLYNQSVLVGLKAAKVAQEASALEEKVIRENIVYNVTATYYSIQVLNDNLLRLTANISNLKKTTQINDVLKNNDLVSDNIHNRMLINLENLQNQYENQKLVLDKNITQLKYLMNVDIHEPVTVNTFYDTDVTPGLDSGNISQRPDILLQHAQLKLSQFDKKSLAASYFPILTNTFSIGYTGYYDSFDPFKQIHNDWIKNTSVTLSLKVPVFNGFRKQHQIRQKELAIQKDINTLSLMKSNADKEVQDATENYITNKKLLASNKKSLELAEQLFNSSQDEYENGIISVTEFLNAQNDLSTARTNYSTALLNLKLAELSLRKAKGTLLTSR